ncbi:MAG TPA: hypothetical protein VHA10_12425 [Hypericibacter adhaerens]|uniref:hypothetical protein n=1 Tax=Hypericibacter adhaerens TaxID=2602016 RepID=UPI002BA8D507|nr:hypothetical protein [Hypericibacter adhaerens]HWA44010.1 hypothetical protein [Hypericibacter adhaerens]
MTTITTSAPAIGPLSTSTIAPANPRAPSRKSGIAAASLIRLSGLFAVAAGLVYAGIQPIHPADVLASVTTQSWAVIISLKLAMCLAFLVGIAGIYARQAGRAGWLGLAGFVVFGLSWFLQSGFVFTELFILPPLASIAPQFVDGFLGIVNGHPTELTTGPMAAAYSVVGLLYLVGGILMGVSTVRAGVLPRAPSVLLALAALVTPAAAMLPHALQRFAAVPVGVAFVWLGIALLLELGRSRA